MPAVSLDEAVEFADHDPHRAGRFRGERDRLRLGLATATLKFEHIGSTAVPGLGGQPIVDLMLGAPPAAWATLPELRARVVALGYEDLGEADVPGRIHFRHRALRAFNLALVELDGALWRDDLALRDYLRAHPEDVAAYAEAKRAAIAGGATTLVAYSAAKAPALAALTEKARAWRAG
ncbi:MAG TPA: GrpB family protein [Polyangia bacterium]